MKLSRIAVALLLLLTVLPAAAAAQHGSITLRCPGGGTATLYRVADRDLNPTAEFSGCDIALTADGARTLADHAAGLPGDTRPLDTCFPDLEEGIYLLVQRRAGAGYQPFSPFLISIPTVIGDTVYYHVDASPKIAPVPKPPGLPQTGQLRWPVPVLAVSGLTLIAFGTRGRGKREA